MWVRFPHSGEEQARQCSESSMCGMRNTGPGGEEGPLVARKHPRGQKMYSGAHRVPGMSHLQLPGPVHSVASPVPYSHGINALKRYVGEAGAGANAWVSQRNGIPLVWAPHCPFSRILYPGQASRGQLVICAQDSLWRVSAEAGLMSELKPHTYSLWGNNGRRQGIWDNSGLVFLERRLLLHDPQDPHLAPCPKNLNTGVSGLQLLIPCGKTTDSEQN